MEKREYTWFRKNPVKKARLDFFLVSESLFIDVDKSCIYPGYRTDHSLIFIQLQLGKFQKGKSYWKMNNSLLKDYEYVKAIKELILQVQNRYASQNQNIPSEIKEIPHQDLLLTINDQLFWETLLLEVRSKTIAYSSYKKKQEHNREAELSKEIENFEKQEKSDFEGCDKKERTSRLKTEKVGRS